MDEEKYQKELFEFDKPKKPFLRLSRILPKADFERNVLITLSLEKVIFISIGILMFLVLVYALGVEVGRSRAIERIASKISAKTPQVVVPVTKVMQITPQAQNLPKPYAIMAGTFARDDNAQNAVIRLKKSGFNAYAIRSGAYFKVYVGSFTSDSSPDAQILLGKIRRMYKDACMVKVR